MVPDAAVVADQSGRMVLTWRRTGTVAPRKCRLGPLVEGLRVVRAGLDPGDRVIIGGLSTRRPGSARDRGAGPHRRARTPRCAQ
jgi:hypothetical protein